MPSCHRYGELGHAPRGMFDLLLRYAISQDGALHAEKFYRTTSEEYAASRPAFRWRQLIALARVTAVRLWLRRPRLRRGMSFAEGWQGVSMFCRVPRTISEARGPTTCPRAAA